MPNARFITPQEGNWKSCRRGGSYVQAMQIEPKCILTEEMKGTLTKVNTLILSWHKEDYFYPWGHIVWTKEGEHTVFSQMGGGYLEWSNLTDHSQHNNRDFSIIKYSLKCSINGNYSCAKIRRGRKNALITSIDLNTSRVTQLLTNNALHKLWLHLALESQQENYFCVRAEPSIASCLKRSLYAKGVSYENYKSIREDKTDHAPTNVLNVIAVFLLVM